MILPETAAERYPHTLMLPAECPEIPKNRLPFDPEVSLVFFFLAVLSAPEVSSKVQSFRRHSCLRSRVCVVYNPGTLCPHTGHLLVSDGVSGRSYLSFDVTFSNNVTV